MIAFSPTSGFENDASSGCAQSRDVSQTLSSPSFSGRSIVSTRSEPALVARLPDDETGHCILVGTRPAVVQVHPWQCMMAGVIAVECLVLIEQIAVRHQPAIDIAIGKINALLTLMLYVADFCPRAAAKCPMKEEKLAVAKNDAGTNKCCVATGLEVECARHLVEMKISKPNMAK